MNEDTAIDLAELAFVLCFTLATLAVLALLFVLAYGLLLGLARLRAWLWQPTNPHNPTGGP